jgi:hypothetical protein
MLANSETLVGLGNAAGIAIGLCVIAAWCFLSGRHWVIGVFCLAFSLMLKPQDAAFVLLFFLLAGGIYRKRAVQSVAVAFAFGLPVVLWITSILPLWPKELAANLTFLTARGGICDPGPTSILWPTAMVNLQTVISLFDNDPHLYNLVTYTLCGALLLPWAYTTIRSKLSVQSAWIALAAISAITLLIDYHRRNDTKLLLLSVPACAMLFSQGGRKGRLALALTSASILLYRRHPLDDRHRVSQEPSSTPPSFWRVIFRSQCVSFRHRSAYSPWAFSTFGSSLGPRRSRKPNKSPLCDSIPLDVVGYFVFDQDCQEGAAVDL